MLLPDNLRSIIQGGDVIKALSEVLGIPIDAVKGAERVIAKALLDFFPTVTLSDGCRVSVLMGGFASGKNITYPLAIKCKVIGYSLNVNKCPIASKLISKALSTSLLSNW
ncbi:hypothetical protein [Vulcanisaeta thermophila]|uniref:hypothetical protein n=1 Tax=Vulcanisaeta thermophila TaxID=867917 RepID=UPI0008529769|nr:hypothetical protein [Vulcanisaeta thermophila]